jgi:hypothetical protein
MPGRLAVRLLALGLGAALGCGGGGGGDAEKPRAAGSGSASVSIGGATYAVSEVELYFEPGQEGYFRIEGEDAAHPEQDCVMGLSGGLGLYGGVPPQVSSLADLAGQRLAIEFTGDGDDANLCFVGTDGLLGAENAWVRFESVEGDRVAFSFSGQFLSFDGRGEREPRAASASGSGTARVATE